MQYLVSVIDDGNSVPTDAEGAAIDRFNEELRENGYWVFAGGLAAPHTATVIDNRRSEPLFTDGPFVETKEHLAGFWVIEAPDLDAALEKAAAGSKACNRKLRCARSLIRRDAGAGGRRQCSSAGVGPPGRLPRRALRGPRRR